MESMLLIFLGAMLTIYFFVGVFASRKVNTTNDYFLAGQSLSVPAITATLLATQIGGGMFLGTAQDPIKGSLYIIGMALGFMVLGMGIAAKLQAFKVTTLGEVFAQKYKSPLMHHITSFLSALSIFGIIIAQMVAAKSVLLHFAGIDNPLLFLAFWAFIIIYTMIGGLTAVVMTDMIQVALIITIFTSICLYALSTNPITFFSAHTGTALYTLWTQSQLSFGQILKIIAMPMLFSIIEQDLAQRFFAAQSKKSAMISAFFAGILLLLFAFVPFYFGIQAHLTQATISSDINPLLPILRLYTSPFFYALAVCALLSAITSTTDSLLCAISAITTQSFTHLYAIKATVKVSRIITFICAIAALIASYFVPTSIITLLIDSYELSVACLLIPLLFCFISNDLKEQAALYACVAGGVSFFILQLPYFTHMQDYSLFITLTISLLGYAIGNTTRSII